jgi:adenine deaminase
MNIAPYSPDRFVIPQQGDRVRVIGLVAGQILTRHLLMEAPVRDGFVVADGDRDLLRIAVLERHRATGNIGLGLVRGFGFRQGALASSVAHDSHNIICVGGDEADLHAAVRAVESMNGGMAAVKNGKVLASLPLPIAGLMSDRPLEEVAAGWESLREAARAMGCRLPEPFMALSFLALPVIPELRITDHGLIDVERFRQAPLFVET